MREVTYPYNIQRQEVINNVMEALDFHWREIDTNGKQT